MRNRSFFGSLLPLSITPKSDPAFPCGKSKDQKLPYLTVRYIQPYRNFEAEIYSRTRCRRVCFPYQGRNSEKPSEKRRGRDFMNTSEHPNQPSRTTPYHESHDREDWLKTLRTLPSCPKSRWSSSLAIFDSSQKRRCYLRRPSGLIIRVNVSGVQE